MTLTYGALIFTMSYLSFNVPPTQPLSMIGVGLVMAHIIYVICLLLYSSSANTWTMFHLANIFIYIKPYITATAVLLITIFIDNKLTLKAPLIRFLTIIFLLAGITIVIPPQSIDVLVYVKASIVVFLYSLSLFIIWKKQVFPKPSIFRLIVSLFAFIIVSEIITIFNRDFSFGMLNYIGITFPLYLIYVTQVYTMITAKNSDLPNRQDLYKLNSDLMNKFLSFKDTEIKGLRSKANAQKDLYKQLFDFAPDAFIICIDDQISYVNQATLALLDTADQNKILNTSVHNFIHPHSKPILRSLHETLLQSQAKMVTDEIKIITLNEDIKDVRISCAILELEGKCYMTLSLHDLTNDKAHQLIQSQLEENISQEKYKVEFFANISHDIKTPVNVIYSAAQLQHLCAIDHEYDKVKMHNSIIQQNCLRLLKLLNDLLDITKLDANHFKPCPKLCNIIYTIENITQSVIPYVEQKNISIIFDTNVEEKYALTDPDLIERILLNLISNAIKYGHEHGHIWVTLYDEGNHLIISIKDDGIGISKNQMPHIFKRFHKVSASTGNPSASNGIGLSLVKSIVDILGGTISCISEEGCGTEFVIILPMISCKEECNDYVCADTNLGDMHDKENNLNIELSNT